MCEGNELCAFGGVGEQADCEDWDGGVSILQLELMGV